MKKVIKGFSAIVGLLSVVFATTASTFWVYKPVAPKSLLNK
jgi:cyclic lactone autoinducer peptide